VSKQVDIATKVKTGLRNSSDKRFMLLFTAPWSPFSDSLDIIARKVKKVEENLEVIVVDLEEYPEIQTNYGISHVPTIILISDKQIKFRGERMMSKKEILKMLDLHK